MSLYDIKHVMLTLNAWYTFDSSVDFIVPCSHSAQDSLQMHLISLCLGMGTYVQSMLLLLLPSGSVLVSVHAYSCPSCRLLPQSHQCRLNQTLA